MREHVLQVDPTLAGPTNNELRMPTFDSGYVWLKEQGMKPALEPKYTGPYQIRRQNLPSLIIVRYGKFCRRI